VDDGRKLPNRLTPAGLRYLRCLLLNPSGNRNFSFCRTFAIPASYQNRRTLTTSEGGQTFPLAFPPSTPLLHVLTYCNKSIRHRSRIPRPALTVGQLANYPIVTSRCRCLLFNLSRPDSAFAIPVSPRYSPFVSTITAILEPDVDGTLHLPLPADMRSSKVKVVATLEAAEDSHANPAAKLKELLASGRKSNGAGATARIAEVYQDRETWRAQ
jgi:hypothetical protein